MANTIDSDATNKMWNRIAAGVGLAGVVAAGGALSFMLPEVIKGGQVYWEQTAKDKEALEKHAPQMINGEPITVEQGIEFILQEHDNNPKDGRVSIQEAIDVLERVKRYEMRTYAGWNESSKNLFQALLEIDKRQTK